MMSILSQTFSFIIDRNNCAPGHGREVVDGINFIEKRFLFKLISTVQIPGEKGYDTKMVIHTGIRTSDVSLASEFQKHLSTEARKHGVIDQGKCKNGQVNKSEKVNIMSRMMLR